MVNSTPTAAKALLRWYRRHRRVLPWREEVTPYRTWISEIMLQQTQVATVIPYFERFLQRFPDVASLAKAPLGDVLKLWEGLGYYTRARNLHRAATWLHKHGANDIPDSLAALRQLPGIGEYTAAAIGSIAFGIAEPVVDGNVARVFCRVFALEAPTTSPATRANIRERLRTWMAAGSPGDFNQAIMELGALICTPAGPRCMECPLRQVCRARIEGRINELPRKVERPETPVRHGVCVVIERRGKWLLLQRPAGGLLGGLWEFPIVALVKGTITLPRLQREMQRLTGLPVQRLAKAGEVTHTYSHFRQSLLAYHAVAPAGKVAIASGQPFRWLPRDDRLTVPLPKITLKVMALMERHACGK